MTGPEQHAGTVRVLKARLYAALKHEKSCVCGECSGGLNAVDALVALAERADMLERERVVERAASVMAETERDVSDEASATWATLLAEAQIAAKQARAEADRLREALKWYAERRNYREAVPGKRRSEWMENQDSFDGGGPGARARAVLSAGEGTPA